jgi:hypothetical protein
MQTGLVSISKIFTERLLRIPDYQRGYSWTEKHLKDFWNDLVQLEPEKNHYTGVLTLEDVPPETSRRWTEDAWIITSKGFAPYYIVDGQQRLTTTIILIQAIIETVLPEVKLNYTTIDEIRKRFIYDSKDGGVSRSYIFGYEKDNPSYEFLKTRIFGEASDNAFPTQETIYTHNLEFAKAYFAQLLEKLDVVEIETLFRKLTQNFLFNVYSISNDVDVYVAFETMNNRGKPLSHLELLKNRLIYLSTKFDTPDYEKGQLRHAINEAWKSVYHYLGKNKQNPLDDDIFLGTHFILYYGDELQQRGEYAREMRLYYRRGMLTSGYNDYLLEEKFTPKNLPVKGQESKREILTTASVYAYVRSLKASVEIWYALMNPADSNLTENEKEWLMKLNRLGFLEVAPLILVFFQTERTARERVKLLKVLERLLFLRTLSSVYPLDFYNINIIQIAGHLSRREIQPEKVVRDLELKTDEVAPVLISQFAGALRPGGFYGWRSLRYFLSVVSR